MLKVIKNSFFLFVLLKKYCLENRNDYICDVIFDCINEKSTVNFCILYNFLEFSKADELKKGIKNL